MNEVQMVEANVQSVKRSKKFVRHLFFDFTQIICSKLKKTFDQRNRLIKTPRFCLHTKKVIFLEDCLECQQLIMTILI